MKKMIMIYLDKIFTHKIKCKQINKKNLKIVDNILIKQHNSNSKYNKEKIRKMTIINKYSKNNNYKFKIKYNFTMIRNKLYYNNNKILKMIKIKIFNINNKKIIIQIFWIFKIIH